MEKFIKRIEIEELSNYLKNTTEEILDIIGNANAYLDNATKQVYLKINMVDVDVELEKAKFFLKKIEKLKRVSFDARRNLDKIDKVNQ